MSDIETRPMGNIFSNMYLEDKMYIPKSYQYLFISVGLGKLKPWPFMTPVVLCCHGDFFNKLLYLG